jgi:CheY-like chemotaxis protein
MTILLVEDDRFYAQRVHELLSDNKMKTVIAASVGEELKCSMTFDGLIADVMLPNNPEETGISDLETRGGFGGGIALYRELRRRGFQGPAVFLSAAGDLSEASVWAKKQGLPFAAKEDGPSAVLAALRKAGLLPTSDGPKAFIVHGHDEIAVSELRSFLRTALHWPDPIVLREQANNGRTIIEKFEDYAGVIDCVFVLLTPDDPSVNLSTNLEKRRARQNVIFELGFFYAKIGRLKGRVIVLRKGNVEVPSDIQGVIWIDITNGISSAGDQILKDVAHLQ